MIKGKVVRVLSEHEVIISVGLNQKVERGMDFVIYKEDEHIFDPTTGEDLGAFEIVKGRVIVTHVMENMSRAKTHSYTVEIPSMYQMARSIGGASTQRQLRKLKVSSSDIRPIEEELTVTAGDLVHSIKN